MSHAATAFADDEDVRQGAIIRIPPGDRARPYCLKITGREPVSQETGAILVHGIVLGVNGTTTRTKNVHRSAVLLPGRYEFVHKVPKFTARIGHLAALGDDGMFDMSRLITRLVVVNETGQPLSAGGDATGPAIIEVPVGGTDTTQRYILLGDFEGRPTPWLTKEFCEQTEAERRFDPIGQCMNRVRNERGILTIGHLNWDLSTWNHWSAQELREVEPGIMAWRDTYVCKHCGQKLDWIKQSPWFRAADGTTECAAEVYVP